MASEPLILCDNLVKIYRVGDHDVVALQGMDLIVEEGDLMGIVGVSGSGKSTLMNVLGGLDRPSAGRVRVAGNDLLKLSDAALDRYRLSTVGFVWQQSSRNLAPFLNAQENVELPLLLGGVSGGKARETARQLLKTVGLEDRRTHRLTELSGGEQQRVAIAVALSNNPRLLLADEPTGEVDTHTAETIYETLHHLNKEFGLTTLIVSHDTNLGRQVNRVVAIRDGKIATETVRGGRRPLFGGSPPELPEPAEHPIDFRELTVLDSAGRLQVPKQYRERFQIKRRVELEVVDEGILIRPVLHEDSADDSQGMIDRMDESRRDGRWNRLRRWLAGGRRA
ncbi:MAG TPA: ATP-binding cassette domain-containing protein [Levilinea sp.]|nr:ATP-binding cassette domain-containing protein [Levilinea sp.]